jgi:geranylgeranyl diphosphate synthase type II
MVGSSTRDGLQRLRASIDAHLTRLVPDPGKAPHRLHAAVNYALLAPGKRLRPLLTLVTAECFGGDVSLALTPACAIEMVHAASLVLDDLPCMDDSHLRRGQPATHVRYGEDVAILAAVALLNNAFGIISHMPGLPPARALDMVRSLSAAVGMDGLVAGQEQDLQCDGSASMTKLAQINHQKTGVLFVAAVEMGALSAGADDQAREALRQFACELGLAFQALDDLDGVDEDEGRATVVSVLGRKGAGAEARRRLQAAKDALRSGGAAVASMEPRVDLLLGLH